MYDTCIRKVMTNPLHEAGAVFASYGVSNSGKTFTILGEKSAGIVPRALAQIFSEYKNQIAERPRVKVVNDTISILNDCEVKMEIGASMDYLQEARTVVKAKHPHQEPWMETEKILEEHSFAQKTTTHQQIFVWISFLEIYNEKIIDLFQPQKSSQENYTVKRALKIISNNHNSFVHGLTWLHVGSLGEALEILQAGVGRVNYAATGMNKHSSRSHTIFTINIIAENELDYELSSYKFCDLAGAERVSKTGNVGDRMKEAGGINSSLMVLRKCLETVQHNQRPGINKSIVPVRESKLTFLLQSSLMGREKFVMICNLLPTSDCFEENINVLHFGSITNKIITQKAEVKRYSKLNFSLTRDDSE